MFQNYLITALRNFTRHKLYSFINIAGLTVGLTCAIFIILFVRDQLSYDKWIPGTENLYRVEGVFNNPGQTPQPSSKIPYAVTQAMLEQIPEVKARARLIRGGVTMIAGNRQFPEVVDSVDPDFFHVIKLPLAAGDPASIFAQPDSVVLSESMARKYFGGAPALGKTITISAKYCALDGNDCQLRRQPLTVTGVMRDLPHNTQLRAEFLIPNTSKADPTNLDAKVNWLHTEGWGYVRLAPGADVNAVTAKLRTIIDHAVDVAKILKIHIRSSDVLTPRLTPFRDAHLTSDRYDGMTPAGSWATVYGFSAIGVLILLVACFNFTNMATARALGRAHEISLRKVVGARRRQIAAQFLSESLLTAMISLALALALSEALMPLFDSFLGAPIRFHYFADWPVLTSIIAIGILVGLLSGAYPALILSSFRPGLSLRANSSRKAGSGLLRTALVVLQFAVSIGLGIAVLVVFAQISFARHVDLGFRKDGIVVIDSENISSSQQESFAKALLANPRIADVAISDNAAIPFARSTNNSDVSVPGDPSSRLFRIASVGPGYAQVYRIRLIAGRLLSELHGNDAVTKMQGSGAFFTSAPYNVMINHTAAYRMGFSDGDAIGKTIAVHGTPVTIVGVIADIKMDGANQSVTPIIYRYISAFTGHVSARIRGEELPATLAFIDRTWRRFAPGIALQRRFLNDDFEGQFRSDEREGAIFSLFVGIAIVIAAMGLFGLAAFSTERRTKEIGIRKTFGARTRDIILLLLWQFSIPVLMANLLAWPVAYFYLHNWLEGYAYRISLNPAYFVGVGLGALLIAWATVIVHAAHVARANPIHALRYE
jgi:putative ABC transport system permease protein